MRSLNNFTSLLTSLVLASVCCCSLAAQPKSTDIVPDFVINTPQLNNTLRGLQGKVVLVDFWASWCKPCRHSFPWMNAMQAKYADAGLQIVAVNLDSEVEQAREFLTANPANLPIVYDPQGVIASAYALVGMPSSYLIDSKGQIRFVHQGFFSAQQSRYEHEISVLLAEME